MDLVRLCRRNKTGSYGTQKNRQRGLNAMAKDLKELGYKLPSARSIKPKHVLALTEKWHGNDIGVATMRNRLSWLRWWAEKVDKPAIIPKANAELNLPDEFTPQPNRAVKLDLKKWAKVNCLHVRATLLLQSAFGLRREEAIKFRPKIADRNTYIALKSAWTKGGKPRNVPITTKHQREVLALIHKIAKTGSLIPQGKSYVQQLKRYEQLTLRVKMRNTHGLRHNYAQQRYLKLTGWKCPLAGGKRQHEMTKEEREKDRLVRLQISKELGHNRLSIKNTYLGKVRA